MVVAAFYQENIFYHHLLPKQSLSPVINPNIREVWPSIFLTFCLLILMLVRWSKHGQLSKITRAMFAPKTLSKLEREERNPFNFSNLALNILFVLSLSFLAYKFNSVYKLVCVQKSNFAQYCFFIIPILFLFTFRFMANKLLAFVTGERKIMQEYINSCALINQSMGFFLLPFLIMAEFSRFNPIIFIYCSLAIVAGSILFKWYRGVVIGLLQERVGLLQTFSYFCALEILPLLVLVKFVIETF